MILETETLPGMGMTDSEARAALAAGAGPDSEAWQSYYGAGGTYSQAPSVIQAAEENFDRSPDSAQEEMPPPRLYAAEVCAPGAGDCIARNNARELANMALMENARRAYNADICAANARANPGTLRDQPCSQFAPVPVPEAPGSMATAVCSGGQCYTPIAGGGSPSKAAQETYRSQYTPAGVPNRTEPPRPQPGEVPAAAQPAGEAPAGGAGPGAVSWEGYLPAGLNPKVVLAGAAALGVGVLLLMRGGGGR